MKRPTRHYSQRPRPALADLSFRQRKMPAKPRRLGREVYRAIGDSWSDAARYLFKKDDAYVFLAEMRNMVVDCVIAERKEGRFTVAR